MKFRLHREAVNSSSLLLVDYRNYSYKHFMYLIFFSFCLSVQVLNTFLQHFLSFGSVCASWLIEQLTFTSKWPPHPKTRSMFVSLPVCVLIQDQITFSLESNTFLKVVSQSLGRHPRATQEYWEMWKCFFPPVTSCCLFLCFFLV